jgi:hypothetical protein
VSAPIGDSPAEDFDYYAPIVSSTRGSEDMPGRDASAAEPSWAKVIGTTLRLWLLRHVLRQEVPGRPAPVPAAPSAPAAIAAAPAPALPGDQAVAGSPARRRVGIFFLVVVVFAAGALTIALAEHKGSGAGTSPGGAGAQPVKLPSGALAQAASNRLHAATWVAAQVSHSAIVSCDPQMCGELQQHGFPAGDLMALNASATDPMGSQIIVSTTALRNQFGSRLADDYAPTVIQTFGSGASRVDIRVDAQEGTHAYLAAQRADLLARQIAGQELLGNKYVHVSGTARKDIVSGDVDSRLLITLVALTHQQDQVYLSGFGDGGPDHAAAPLRTVQIDALVPHQKGKPSTYEDSVVKFLHAQQAPYQASVTVLHQSQKNLIQIQFTAPGTLGLLGAHG